MEATHKNYLFTDSLSRMDGILNADNRLMKACGKLSSDGIEGTS